MVIFSHGVPRRVALTPAKVLSPRRRCVEAHLVDAVAVAVAVAALRSPAARYTCRARTFARVVSKYVYGVRLLMRGRDLTPAT